MSDLDEALYQLNIMRKKIPIFSVWKHFKGNKYMITNVGLKERDLTPIVAYIDYNARHSNNSITWFRPVHEFLDGRFTPEEVLDF